VWLEFQDCAGNTEALLRASKPTVGDIVLDILSVDYHETIMAPAGKQAEKSLMDVVKNQKGKYLVVVEGSIPMKDGGVYCCISGRSAVDIRGLR
jgi:hydrogenase small subunit